MHSLSDQLIQRLNGCWAPTVFHNRVQDKHTGPGHAAPPLLPPLQPCRWGEEVEDWRAARQGTGVAAERHARSVARSPPTNRRSWCRRPHPRRRHPAHPAPPPLRRKTRSRAPPRPPPPPRGPPGGRPPRCWYCWRAGGGGGGGGVAGGVSHQCADPSCRQAIECAGSLKRTGVVSQAGLASPVSLPNTDDRWRRTVAQHTTPGLACFTKCSQFHPKCSCASFSCRGEARRSGRGGGWVLVATHRDAPRSCAPRAWPASALRSRCCAAQGNRTCSPPQT